jgi:hypothetical protein
MSSALWNQPGIPHRGWHCTDVEDLGDLDGTCEMCGTPIRYVHTMRHHDHERLGVGCVCAEKMSDDYVGPRKRERELKNQVARNKRAREKAEAERLEKEKKEARVAQAREGWLSRPEWRRSSNGALFIAVQGFNITTFPDEKGEWGFCWWKSGKQGQTEGAEAYATSEEAALAAFDDLT